MGGQRHHRRVAAASAGSGGLIPASISSAVVDRARREVDEGRLPAVQLAIARHGELILFESLGDATDATRFLIWSCSKAIVAALTWRLISDSRLTWSTSVADVLPEFATNDKASITVDHLLQHTAGIPDAPMSPQRWATQEGRAEAYGRWRLMWEPGSRYQYHQTSAGWVLADVAAAMTGTDHRQLTKEWLAEPLGLQTLQLGVPAADQHDVAPLAIAGEPATPEEFARAGLGYTGPPSFPAVAALALGTPAALEVGIPAGGAVMTAADLALLYQALLHNPVGLWDADVLHDGTENIHCTHIDTAKWNQPSNRSRGLVVRGTHPLAHLLHHFGPGTSPRTFGHDGAFGQIAWADPESGLSFAYLTSGIEANRVREITRCQDLSTLAADLAT